MNTLCGWNVEFWKVNLVVCMLTTALQRVNSYSCLRSSLIPQKHRVCVLTVPVTAGIPLLELYSEWSFISLYVGSA